MPLTMIDRPSIDTLIFDVGEVLVQLKGIQQMIDWCVFAVRFFRRGEYDEGC
jgi:hypothetical protein